MYHFEHLYDESERLPPDLAYDEYNKLYFGNQLPKIPVKWSRKHTEGCGGVFHHEPMAIYLNPGLKGWNRLWCIVLLHEMVHVEQRNDAHIKDHGRKFQNRMKRLVTQGALQALW